MTKFKSEGLHIIRIKYWNASGSGSGPPPSFIPILLNIGILLHKQATLGKDVEPECTYAQLRSAILLQKLVVYISADDSILF